MHLPDGYLSAASCGVTWAAAAAGIGLASYALRRRAAASSPAGSRARLLVPGTLVEKTAGAAAVAFAAQMVNFPILPGVSGHLIGGGLAAALVGWAPAAVAMSVVLVVQAALFGDGGAASLGANLLNMALVAPLAAEGVLRFLSARRDRRLAAMPAAAREAALPIATAAAWTGVAAFAGTLAASLACGLELALSGVGGGGAAFAKIVAIHLPIAAAEGVVSAFVAAGASVLLAGRRAQEASAEAPSGRFAVGRMLVWAGLAAATAVLLAPWASSLPDGLEAAAENLGFASLAAEPRWAWLPDYAFPGGSSAWYETAAIGLLGAAAAGLLALACAWSAAQLGGLLARDEDAPA